MVAESVFLEKFVCCILVSMSKRLTSVVSRMEATIHTATIVLFVRYAELLQGVSLSSRACICNPYACLFPQ
jgi:hypothetical protein